MIQEEGQSIMLWKTKILKMMKKQMMKIKMMVMMMMVVMMMVVVMMMMMMMMMMTITNRNRVSNPLPLYPFLSTLYPFHINPIRVYTDILPPPPAPTA